MFLPDWIYRMLPYLYVVVGLVVATNMDSPLGVAAGVILVITGILVWKMRVDYRRETAVRKPRRNQTIIRG